MNHRLYAACLAVCFLLPGFSNGAQAQGAHNTGVLSSGTIAGRALSVAERRRTSGYCYSAVSQALDPLGIKLRGRAAYQARDLLLHDRRFMPVVISSVDQLQRGDIIVYNRSSSHPYGHIAVYEGNYEEASDHISSVTSTWAYGGATVFRLRSETVASALPPSGYENRYDSPPYSSPAGYEEPRRRRVGYHPAPRSRMIPAEDPETAELKHTWNTFRQGYRLARGEPLETTVVRQVMSLMAR